ncbi:unnamed protein product, partial [Prorocentrum cordatum]
MVELPALTDNLAPNHQNFWAFYPECPMVPGPHEKRRKEMIWQGCENVEGTPAGDNYRVWVGIEDLFYFENLLRWRRPPPSCIRDVEKLRARKMAQDSAELETEPRCDACRAPRVDQPVEAHSAGDASNVAQTCNIFDGKTVSGILQECADEDDYSPLVASPVKCAEQADEEAARGPPCDPEGPTRPHPAYRFDAFQNPSAWIQGAMKFVDWAELDDLPKIGGGLWREHEEESTDVAIVKGWRELAKESELVMNDSEMDGQGRRDEAKRLFDSALEVSEAVEVLKMCEDISPRGDEG